MRPVIEDFLDALTAQPSERMERRELDRHHRTILEGYHCETQAVRESFLNDDVFSLLFRHSLFDNMFARRQRLADKGVSEPPTERERADHDRILGDIEDMAFFITQDVYDQFAKLQLNKDTLAMGDRIILRHSSQTFSDHIRLLVYKMKPQDTPPPPEPQPILTMATDRTAEDLTRIFTDLQAEGFISQESRLLDWLKAWGKADDEASTPEQREPFKCVVWVKKNSRTGEPNKKSLLDLLYILGFNVCEYMIIKGRYICTNKDVVNDLIDVAGTTRYITSDDTNRFAKSKLKSEYHDILEKIVTKGK